MTVLYRRAEVGNHVPNAGVEQKKSKQTPCDRNSHLNISIGSNNFALLCFQKETNYIFTERT